MGNKPAPLQLQEEHKTAFLELVRSGMTLEAAARKLGFSRRTFHRRTVRDDSAYDPDFAEAFIDAWLEGTGALVEEARRRGVDGWDEPVFQKGEAVGTVRRYDSRLLELLIKQRDPTFRDRVEVTGANGGPVQTQGEVRHVVALEDVFGVLARAGAVPGLDGGGAARKALPAPDEVLAEPPDG